MYPGLLRFSVGYHPELEWAWRGDKMAELRELAADPACVAVGECGLDFSDKDHDMDRQTYIFFQQLNLALNLHKPVLVYERDAQDKLLEILSLNKDKLPRVAVRSHKPTPDFMNKVTKLGCYIVLTGAWRRGCECAASCQPFCPEWSKMEHWQLEKVLLASNAPSDKPFFIKAVVLDEYQRALWKINYKESFSSSAIEWATEYCCSSRNEPCCIPGLIEWFATAVQLPAKDAANICLENSKRFFQETDDVSQGSKETTAASWKWEQAKFWMPLAVLIIVVYISTLCVCDIFCRIL